MDLFRTKKVVLILDLHLWWQLLIASLSEPREFDSVYAECRYRYYQPVDDQASSNNRVDQNHTLCSTLIQKLPH